jgi:hypothetical protein|tara:strand:- start:253 stop:402 length:150 start_codon:yes stop_codon:yes gene_type:complete
MIADRESLFWVKESIGVLADLGEHEEATIAKRAMGRNCLVMFEIIRILK